MEEPKHENQEKHTRITLLSFFYALCIIAIISVVCIGYVVRQNTKKAEQRIEQIEKNIEALQQSYE